MPDTPTSVHPHTQQHPTVPPFQFVDLFAGVGGFHAALSAYGGHCAYAVESDPAAAEVYHRNWNINPFGDITNDANDTTMNVPPHDVLTAGFPCQPFSKSGAQRGMDETRGTLFWNIVKIIEQRTPHIVLLENVRNLAGPRHRHEWDIIINTLRELNYRVSDTPAIISPHVLPPHYGGRPQVRERVFITATHNPDNLQNDNVPPAVNLHTYADLFNPHEWSVEDILDDLPPTSPYALTDTETLWINAWDEWVQLWYHHTNEQPPSFPIWADSWADLDAVLHQFTSTPSYQQLMEHDPALPRWKAQHLAKNYAMYATHRQWIDPWLTQWNVYSDAFPASRRKLEWQAQRTPSLWESVMQLRPSGIRAKRNTYLPALVAITQTSIVGTHRRRLSPRETARLQGLPETFTFGQQRDALSYKQMGNGVNVGVVWHVLRQHVERDHDLLLRTPTGQRIIDTIIAAPQSPDIPLNAAALLLTS